MLGAFRHAAKNLRRQVVRLDARLRANNDQALDEVAKLADIARPRVPQQNLHGGIGELARSLAIRGAELVQEIPGQDRNVLFAVAQGRHEEGNYVQPVKEILAEGAARDLLLEILVRGRQYANIDTERLAGADRLEALLFQHAQHFRLRAQTHVADFVEEERATVGFLEFADLIFRCAREAALHVAKKFGFDQLLWDGRAVHFDKQAFAAQAGGVQGARHELLARAALAINQHAAVGRRGDRNLLPQRFHGHTLADDLIAMAQLRAQKLILFLQAPLLNGVADEHDDFFERKRLLDDIEGPELCGAHGGFDGAVAGDHDNGGRALRSLQAAESLQAIHAWQPHIEKNHFHFAARGALQCFLSGGHGFDVVAFVLQNRR